MYESIGLWERIDAKCRLCFVEPAKNERPDVTSVETALFDKFDRRVAKCVAAKLRIHSIDLCRIYKPLHVFRQAKYRRSFSRVITADTLKNAGAVIDHVGHHVDACVVPVNKLTVFPHL